MFQCLIYLFNLIKRILQGFFSLVFPEYINPSWIATPNLSMMMPESLFFEIIQKTPQNIFKLCYFRYGAARSSTMSQVGRLLRAPTFSMVNDATADASMSDSFTEYPRYSPA